MKTKIFCDGLKGQVRRSRERNARREAGERLEPERILTFDNPLDMFEAFTVQRMRLWQAVKKDRMSVSALALALGRNRGSVTRDVNKLKSLGLLRLREEVNPGHGVLQIVEPVAKNFEVHLSM